MSAPEPNPFRVPWGDNHEIATTAEQRLAILPTLDLAGIRLVLAMPELQSEVREAARRRFRKLLGHLEPYKVPDPYAAARSPRQLKFGGGQEAV